MPVGVSRLSLPSLRVSASAITGVIGNAALTLSLPTIAASGRTDAVGGATLRVPSLQLVAAGDPGVSGNAALTLPRPVLSLSSGNIALLRAPSLQMSAAGVVGTVGAMSLRLPSVNVLSAGDTPVVGSAVLTLRAPSIQIAASAGQSAAAALTLRKLALAASGVSGSVGTVALTLPIVRLDATGYGPAIGVAQLTLPSLHLVATGRSASLAAPQTFAMHTETMALTQYSNFPFNSFAQFNGVYLGASDAGIFALTGATDNGAAINAYARVGITDFATSHLKRVDRAYVGYRSDGDLVLRIITDEVQQRDYLMRRTVATPGIHGNLVRFGKGLAARYWQFEVRNVNGSDFDLNIVELKPTTLRRRFGGLDA